MLIIEEHRWYLLKLYQIMATNNHTNQAKCNAVISRFGTCEPENCFHLYLPQELIMSITPLLPHISRMLLLHTSPTREKTFRPSLVEASIHPQIRAASLVQPSTFDLTSPSPRNPHEEWRVCSPSTQSNDAQLRTQLPASALWPGYLSSGQDCLSAV